MNTQACFPALRAAAGTSITSEPDVGPSPGHRSGYLLLSVGAGVGLSFAGAAVADAVR
ncbi:hypothetical protein OG609_03555 [Streptomyces sp. NBC_01224]|uniref:hypothetical protein n=1 Tax=unclassified Streptomyces TaxID=2593676 RepID=UPI002E13FA0A|nr:hypothetical protein OG609_03555 [Streptomyces sp. NBC_01224]